MKIINVLFALIIAVGIFLPFSTVEAVQTTPFYINGSLYAPGEEVVEMRQENSKTTYLGKVGKDDKYSLDVSMGPIHYKDNYNDDSEQWKDIDLTPVNGVVTKAPYTLIVDGAKVTVTDKKTGSVTVLELTDVESKKLSKQSVSLSKGRASKANIDTDTDLDITWSNTQIRVTRVLKSNKASPSAKFNLSQTGNGIKIDYRAEDSSSDVKGRDKSSKITHSIDNGVLTESIDTSGLVYPVRIDPTLDILVGASTDDCMVIPGTTTMFLAAANNYWGITGSGVTHSGYRFLNITIPQGGVIDAASMNITCSSTSGIGGSSVGYLSADDADNSATFSTYANFMGRALTTASINWTVVLVWPNVYSTPSLVSSVQEVIDRAGWVSGNSLSIIYRDTLSTGNPTIYTWDGDPAQAAKLHIEYADPTAPAVSTQAVSSITPTTATGNGNVTSNGGSAVTSRGTVIAVAANPTTADHTDNTTGTTGAFTTSITGLTKGTLYHVRAFASNAIGTGYGVDESFTTINDPTITPLAASVITTTTARLNSQVTFDGAVGGGEACTVTFVYKVGSPFANYAAILAAGGTEVVAAGTYTVGQFPNYDVAGLTLGTLYSFAVKIANSTATDAYGSVLTFTTASGISDTTALTAIPTATTVSLAWVKGTGAGFTLVRYSASVYPSTTADGTVAYLGTGNSYLLTGLTAGTTYYFSAWGKTGALYSGGYVTALATTLAFDTAVSTGAIEVPPTNSWWNQTPSSTKVSAIPMISGLVTANATAYAIPEASLWYFLWVLFSVGIGVFIYSKSGNNLPMSLGAQALLFALGAVLGLVMLWIMVIFMVIGAGFTLWGNRH